MGLAEQDRVDGYQGTVQRLEPEIHPIDAAAFYASAAISLKRIADSLEKMVGKGDGYNAYGEDFLPALTRAISDGIRDGRP